MIIQFFPFYAISLLPFRLVYVLADFAYVLLYYVFKYRRKVVCENLAKGFPEKTDQERKLIAKHFYKHLADVFLETIMLLSTKKKILSQRFKIKNPELLEQYKQERQSIIFCSSHHGNWEWFSLVAGEYHHCKMLALYQRIDTPYFDELLKLIRQRFGAICIESRHALRHIARTINMEGVMWCYVIADQSPHIYSPTYQTLFLNQSTTFLTGIQRLVDISNAVPIFPHFRKIQRGFYEVELIPIAYKKDDDFSVVEGYAHLLEQALQEIPHLWLWTHRRWKNR